MVKVIGTILLLLTISSFFGWVVVRGVKSGNIPDKGRFYERQNDPERFWVLTSLYSVVCLIPLIALILLFAEQVLGWPVMDWFFR
jgi:hypothetical protein